MADNNTPSNGKDRNPVLLAILVIAAVIIVAAIGYVYISNYTSRALPPPGDGQGPVEEMIDEANPFPEAQQMNLPPMDEMVTEDAPQAPVADSSAPGEEMTQAAPSLDVQSAMSPRYIGQTSAPIKMKEYFSLTCGHCAQFHNETLPALKKYIDSGELYIEFHEFPLNAPALRASMIARCLPENRYYGFITLLFKMQDVWTSNPDYMTPLRQNAKLAGMSDAEFDSCLENNQLQQAMGEDIKQAMDQWKIESTPTFIINDGVEKVSGAQPAYEFERVFRKVTDGKVAPLPAGSAESAPAQTQPE